MQYRVTKFFLRHVTTHVILQESVKIKKYVLKYISRDNLKLFLLITRHCNIINKLWLSQYLKESITSKTIFLIGLRDISPARKPSLCEIPLYHSITKLDLIFKTVSLHCTIFPQESLSKYYIKFSNFATPQALIWPTYDHANIASITF